MRTKITSIKKALPILLSGMFLILFSACGTHNNGYGDNDGIYTSEEKATTVNDSQKDDKTNYYKQYFKSKNGTYDELPEEGAIFTDIEAYSTTDTIDEDGYIVIEENDDYGAWGSNSDDVTVNVYNYGGYGYGYWHQPYWYGGWGYHNYWYSPYWGISYGWGYPYYGGYYCSPYYGGYYNPYYYHGYGYYNNIAYNRGRRNTDYLASRNYSRNRSNATRDIGRRGTYSSAESARRSNRDVSPRTRPQSEARPSSGTRPQVNTRPRTRPQTEARPAPRTRPQVNTRPRTRPQSESRPAPRTRPQVNSRRSSSNRGGSMRSSSGSSRSSGTRSSGRRGGGRN